MKPTFSDGLKELRNTVTFGEAAWIAHGAGTDEPEEHSKRVDIDTAIILG